MTAALTVGLVQMSSTADVAENIETAERLIRQAAKAGAGLIATPENTGFMEFGAAQSMALARPEGDDPTVKALSALAAELGIWLLIGSNAVRVSGEKLANRSFLISDRGETVARYDKIHMFDVDLPGGESYRESKIYAAGDTAVGATTPWGGLGLSICYDLRFPHLYRKLALPGAGRENGAAILAVPSAFTRQTGEAHWHILLRARAIETGCFVIAPAQCGSHAGGRETFGHSLVVSPWGKIIADGGTEPGIIIAQIDLSEVDRARSAVPSLWLNRELDQMT